MMNIVITGTASGLGRAFVLLYASAADDATHIYAIDKAFPSADAAKTFAGSSKSNAWIQQHVHQYTVDVTNAEETSGFGQLLDIDDKPIHLLGTQEEDDAERLSDLAVDLRRALDEDEIELRWQPQVAIGSGAIVGVEALARWRHPALAKWEERVGEEKTAKAGGRERGQEKGGRTRFK